MGETARFGVSMDKNLVDLLDKLTREGGHPNRSETLRELVRKEIINTGKDDEREVIGTVTLLYHMDTRLPRVPVKDYPSLKIRANIQLHVEKDICVKVLILKGSGGDVQSWSRQLLSRRGILGRLNIAATDEFYKELRRKNIDFS